MKLIKLFSNKYHYLKHRWMKKLTPILWPNSIENYPIKCRRYPEETKQFMAERRLKLNQKPIQRLSLDTYRELIVDNESETAIKGIVDYFNSSLIKNQFCPTTVTVEDMKYLLIHLDTFHRKMRFLDFLFVREFDIWRNFRNKLELKAIKAQNELKLMQEIKQIGCFDEQNDIQYGFWRNTLFSRFFHKGVQQYSTHYLRNATLFGQKFVIDCSYDKEMQEYETKSCGRQMAKIYAINRMESRDPFDLHFCNCDPNSRVFQQFIKRLNPLNCSKAFDKLYLNIHSKTYSELFPNERLIYLSPDARRVMTDFDPKAIYILGSLVGKTCSLPLSRRKAEREGIECYRLPIHRFVALNPNVKKVLSFQSCFKVLLEVKDHNDWQLAFLRGIQEHKLKDNIQL